MNTEEDNVTVRLRRDEYEVLKRILKEREAYSVFADKAKNLWVWAVAGGILVVWALWDKLQLVVDKN